MNTLLRDQMLRHDALTSTYEFSGLQATAQVLRDTMKRGCDCSHLEEWGHWQSCSGKMQRAASIEQSLNEAESLRMTWVLTDDGRKASPDLQGFFCEEFAPGNAGWRVITSL